MAKHRKTIDVAHLVDMCNKMLKMNTSYNNDEFRKGVIGVLENVLFATDNYAGFDYLSWCVEQGEDGLTGVERWRQDRADWRAANHLQGSESLPTSPYLGNETRRVYYTHRKLLQAPAHTHSAPEDTDTMYPKGLDKVG